MNHNCTTLYCVSHVIRKGNATFFMLIFCSIRVKKHENDGDNERALARHTCKLGQSLRVYNRRNDCIMNEDT